VAVSQIQDYVKHFLKLVKELPKIMSWPKLSTI